MAGEPKTRWTFASADMQKLLGEVAEYKGESLWQDAWRRLKRNRSAFWSMIFLALFCAMALLAPVLPLASPVALSLRSEAAPPSWPWQSPPMTTIETKQGAAVTSSFGAVMDNGWRHRSIASFYVEGGQDDAVGTGLLELVEEVSGRNPVLDRRSPANADAPTGFHLGVPYDPDDPARTDWQPTSREGQVIFLRSGGDLAWALFELEIDETTFTSWAMEMEGRNGRLVLRSADGNLMRHSFRLERAYAGEFAGITLNGRRLSANGNAEADGPIVDAPLMDPAVDLSIAFEDRALVLIEALELEEDTEVWSESSGLTELLFQREKRTAVEEEGIVHDDYERLLRAALVDWTPPAGTTIVLDEVACENGYWELKSADLFLLSVRAKLFGLWQTGNWMGTDSKGRDIMARIVWGSRTSLIVAIIATICSLIIGVTYGAFSGLMGGRIDNLMMRIVDILYSLPFIFVVIFLITIMNEYRTELEDTLGLDREKLFYLVIGAIYWLTMARVVRGQVLSLKNSEFIEAARVIGASTPRILFAHLVPNVLSIVIVYLTLTIPAVMLFEAFLSFLGLGIEPPKVSWGTLAVDGTEAVNPVKIFWWLVFFPAMAMGSTLLALNVLGDGLRDALDPKLRGKD